MDHNHQHLNLIHFPGQNLHYHRHPPQASPSPSLQQCSTPTDTLRRILLRVDTATTTVTIPPATHDFTPAEAASTTSSPASPIKSTTTSMTNPTAIISTPISATVNTGPRINTSRSTSHPTTASRNEITLLALGIFILVAQLALIIWVGNCPRELDGLQLDGRGSHGHGHKGKKCLWKEAFGEEDPTSPTSPGSWRERNRTRARGLRGGEDVEGEEEGEREDGEGVDGLEGSSGTGSGTGTGSGLDEEDLRENEDADEGVGEGIRSRGNSAVIAGAHELVERVRKRSNSLGTLFKRIGAGKGEHVEEVPEDQQETATRKRSNTFTMGLVRGINTGGAGEAGLRERKGSAATTTAREGDVEMGVGKTSGLNTDFGGKFDGIEERDDGGGSERRRGSWVQVLRGYSGLGNQNGVQDPEKGGYWC
ncbi:hypothetical protein B0T09DRAFT_319976 [Sordaria sp. MPI-SDFR-AT-0083]|nr:hypothetical protein B0T09DRAFT_319976 [Sordaria sp. MPI-SDFR-AT-0083]